MGVLWASSGSAGAQESALQRRAAARVPLEAIPTELRERVRVTVQKPTLFSLGPAESFAGSPKLYRWLLDHPDRGVQAWRRLGAHCMDITARGDGSFGSADGHGSEVHWQTIHDGTNVRVWYAAGKMRPGLLLPALPFQAVLVLRHGLREDGPEHALIFHQADVFVHTDSKTAAVLAKMLGTSAPRLAEQALGQLELFFSGLVWYFDQHPERADKLLAQHQSTLKASP
jgi:hypothetical protein